MSEGAYVASPWEIVADQVALYEASGGLEGNTLKDVPVIILHTIGRKTGSVRKSPLMRVEHDGNYAMFASMGGAPSHPAWYLNLEGAATANLQDGPELKTFRVHEATGDERAQWWARGVEVWPDYDLYQTLTDRVIPVVILDPA